MNIGLTYDLQAEYLAMGYSEEETAELDSEQTVGAIEQALRELGHRTERIGHARALMPRLLRGDRWDLVFNICEGMHGVGREALVPALLDSFGIAHTFSDAAVTALTLHKGLTKRAVRDLGVETPEFAVVGSRAEATRVNLPVPLFVKPVQEGSSKGVTPRSLVRSLAELPDVCAGVIERFDQPALVERYLPGREVTVGVVGTGDEARVVGVLEVAVVREGGADSDFYSFENKENWRTRMRYTLTGDEFAREAAEAALRVWRGLGCRDAGRLDFKADEAGRASFLEVNPLAGLNPEKSDLPIMARLAGMEYAELIGAIVESAARRVVAGH